MRNEDSPPNLTSSSDINWDRVKKITLWSYEELISKLKNVLSFDFIKEHYNHNMPQAQEYARAIRRGYLGDRGKMTGYIDSNTVQLAELEAHGIGTYDDLVHQIASRKQCEDFLMRSGIDFEGLIQTLNYIFRWVLPFKTPLSQLIDADEEAHLILLGILKSQQISSNLDLLEVGRYEVGRERLSYSVGLQNIAPLFQLIHRADISRLAFVRGKTIRHLCNGGYDTLNKIASANLIEMERRMDDYYHTLGKCLSDFKAVIPLNWVIGGAHVIPYVLDE